MDTSKAYETAKKRVEAKMAFYTHVTVYLAVILLLAAINFLNSSSTIWVHWPILGWGLALVIHAFTVFAFPERFVITEKMIESEIDGTRGTSSFSIP